MKHARGYWWRMTRKHKIVFLKVTKIHIMRLSEKEGEVRLLFHVHQVNLIFLFLFTPLLDFFFFFLWPNSRRFVRFFIWCFLENKKFQFSAINFHLGYHFLPHARRYRTWCISCFGWRNLATLSKKLGKHVLLDHCFYAWTYVILSLWGFGFQAIYSKCESL